MKSMIKYIGIYGLALLVLSACQPAPEDQESAVTQHAAKPADEHTEGLVTLTPRQCKAIDLTLGTIQQKNLSGTIKANGQLELPPQNEASVSAVVGGNIYKINVIEGDKVSKGETLALLEHPDLVQMQTDLQNAANRLQYLKQEYQRQKRLYENEVGSGKEFQQISSEYQSAQSRLEGLKIKLQMLHLNPEQVAAGKIYRFVPVMSPIGGYIKKVNIKTGAYVAPQQVMFGVINNQHIHADLMVFEKDIFKVKKGQKVRFTVSNVPEKQMTATIYSVGKAFESNPKALHLHAEIENKEENLIPGMYVQGRIMVEDFQTQALPEDAIVTEGEKSYIFVLTKKTLAQQSAAPTAATAGIGDGQQTHPEATPEQDSQSWTFQQVEVVTGVKDQGFIEVKPVEPLPENVQVAYNAAYYLLSEMQKGEAEHSH